MKQRLIGLTLLGTILADGSPAMAHSGATGVVKERMDLMEIIGRQMKVLSAVFKGEVDYDPQVVREAAAAIGDHAGDKVAALFPEDSLAPPTEALPAIWLNWERFTLLSRQLASYSDALVQAVNNPSGSEATVGSVPMLGATEDVDPAALATMAPEVVFLHLAQTCSACHREFRTKKNH
ncbi:MAG: cytochrome c [Pseudomonadota bacterium]